MNNISPDFIHGSNFQVGNYTIIKEKCIVGNNVIIEDFVRFNDNTIIGNDCFIDSYVKSSGDVLIENGCTLRYNCTIARNVVIHDNVFIAPNVMTIYSKNKRTIISSNVKIYTGTVIDAGVDITEGCEIGAMSFVNRDCLVPGKYFGVPAKLIERF